MAKLIWAPLEELAVQMKHGRLVAELKVAGGRIVVVKVLTQEPQWTLQDLQGPTLIE